MYECKFDNFAYLHTAPLFFQNPCAIFAHNISQRCSRVYTAILVQGRIKLIIFQIRNELSVTIDEICELHSNLTVTSILGCYSFFTTFHYLLFLSSIKCQIFSNFVYLNILTNQRSGENIEFICPLLPVLPSQGVKFLNIYNN